MARVTLAFLLAFLGSEPGILAQQPGTPNEQSPPATAPVDPKTEPQVSSQFLSVIPLTIEPSENFNGENVAEFAGRNEVLKSVMTANGAGPRMASVEVKLPEGFLDQRPAYKLYLCLSVFPPAKGAANLAVRQKQKTDIFLFRSDINQTNVANSAILRRKEGWVDMQFSLDVLEKKTESIVLELTGDPTSSDESPVYWATGSLHGVSQISYEELDPTKQTLFRRYSERGYGQLVDVATGKALKSQIGIGWIATHTSCLFSQDGSHVAIICKVHEHPRSGNTDYEHLWVFSLRPFELVQEAKSRAFHAIQFDQENKTLLFESRGGPEISGR